MAKLPDPAPFGLTLSDTATWTKLFKGYNEHNYYNPLNPDFGAVGDGVADDRAAIQACITAAAAAGATMTITKPTAYYKIGSPGLVIPTGTGFMLLFESWATELRAASGMNTDLISFGSSGGVGITGAVIINGYLNHDGANQTAGGCLNAKGAVQCQIVNMHMTKGRDYALRLGGIVGGTNGHHNQVIGGLYDVGSVSAGEGLGLLVQASDQNFIGGGVHFEDCGGASGTEIGAIRLESGLQVLDGGFCVGGKDGIRVKTGVNEVTISNWQFSGCGRWATILTGGACSVSNCKYLEGGQNSAGVYGHILMDADGRHTVHDNNFRSAVTNGQLKVFIEEASAAGNSRVHDNGFDVAGSLSGGLVVTRGVQSGFWWANRGYTSPEDTAAGGGGSAIISPRPALIVVYSNDFPSVLKSPADTWTYRCDGVSDEAEINSAIAQAALTRGDVKLLGLLYKTRAPILLKTATMLKGLDMNVTRIEADTTGWVGDRLVGLNDVNVHAYGLEDIWFDGKNVAGISGVAIDNTGGSFTGTPSTSPDPSPKIRRLRIYSCMGKGLWIIGNNRGINVSEIVILNAGQEGLYVAGPDGSYYGIDVGSSGGVGVYSVDTNNRFTNIKSWYSDSHGFQLSSGNRNSYTNCEAQDNLGNGFLITSGRISLQGCHADSNSYDGSPSGGITGRTFYGFDVRNCGGLTLEGCHAYDKNENSRGARQLYGIIFNAACTNGIFELVTWGNFSGSKTGTQDASNTINVKTTDGF